jgi:hypothetical protein
VIVRGHAVMQNIRRGHNELRIDARAHRRIAHAFSELARTVWMDLDRSLVPARHRPTQRNRALLLLHRAK